MTKQSAWALICVEGQYLFTRRSESTSRPGQWCVPGGGIHASESPGEACVREVLEEVGLAVTVTDLVCQDEGFTYFQCQLTKRPALIVLEPRECSDFRWVEPRELTQLGPIMEFARMKRVFLKLGVPIATET